MDGKDDLSITAWDVAHEAYQVMYPPHENNYSSTLVYDRGIPIFDRILKAHRDRIRELEAQITEAL